MFKNYIVALSVSCASAVVILESQYARWLGPIGWVCALWAALYTLILIFTGSSKILLCVLYAVALYTVLYITGFPHTTFMEVMNCGIRG